MAAAVSACTASDPRAYACTALARINVNSKQVPGRETGKSPTERALSIHRTPIRSGTGSGLLIHPHVVDLHAHREDGVVDAHLSAPVAPDGDIEDQELRTVEWPFGIAGAVIRVL